MAGQAIHPPIHLVTRSDEPIRSLGTHEVRVKLFHDVEPVVTVEVTAKE